MTKYTCEKCLKSFTQKSHYDAHTNRKYPCLDDLVEKIIEQKVKKAMFKTNVDTIKDIDENLPSGSVSQTIQSNDVDDYTSKTREQLIVICKQRDIKGYSGKNKKELVSLLTYTKQVTISSEVPPPPSTDSNKNGGSIEFHIDSAFEYLKKDTQTYTCIYLDPPYASGRDYKFADKDETAAFTDKFTPEKYKEWLSNLIALCKKRLAKDGTLWFHIAAEYSFIPEQVLTAEFKEVEKIFWKKSHGKNTVKNKMGAVIDIIFRCYNSTPVFNLQYVPLDPHYFENSYRNKDEKGLYALGSLRFDKTRSGNNYAIIHDGITYTAPYGWKIRKEEMERLITEKRIHFVTPNEKREGNLYKKLYKSECKGKPLSNLWDDISYITRTQIDPRTYPTQKPLKLLQRIISISTNKGDLVLDPTAGSGTTGIACKTLGRQCCLIDINPDAKAVFEKRLTETSDTQDEPSPLIE